MDWNALDYPRANNTDPSYAYNYQTAIYGHYEVLSRLLRKQTIPISTNKCLGTIWTSSINWGDSPWLTTHVDTLPPFLALKCQKYKILTADQK